jgi:hypothetical protein
MITERKRAEKKEKIYKETQKMKAGQMNMGRE